MKTVALIPIKMGSKRTPQKNIKPFYDGTPLMHFVQRNCLQSKYINEVYVYCSDEAVKEYVLPGVHFLKRPEWLDRDDSSAVDILTEFVKTVPADIYVKAHATSPFAKPETIDSCIEKVMSGEYDSAFCARDIKGFLWRDGKPINYDLRCPPRTQDLPDVYEETSIAYVCPKETFDKYRRVIGEKPYIQPVDQIEAVDIDYPLDFEIADAIYKEIIGKSE
jgi:CMP-N-acetylneuraminic acid synthetase